ncbi:MAG: glycerophosphodiester phosphodiesterase family protein, partial [Candidatus Competibacterales bacterium]|nr:glycerophosphodiester phosphodiesterase family protein [Candidatus Competibacterales bacterium]
MEVVAHRGASGEAPENTLAAFRLAWQQQADGIECDVHLSRDARVMVHHDPDTRRCAGVDCRIAETDSDCLRRLDVGRWKSPSYAGERMPYLEEVLALAPAGTRVLVELKCGPEIVPALARSLAGAGRIRLALIAFRTDSLDACRRQLPDYPCYLLAAPECPDAGYDAAKLIHLARQHGCAGLDLDHRGLDSRAATRIQAVGMELLCWTVNDPERAIQLRDWGVGVLTTD